MLRLSVSARHSLARLTLPVTLAVALCLLLAGQADQRLPHLLRGGLDDVLAPLYRQAVAPLTALEHGQGAVGTWFRMHREIARLQAENRALRRWRSVALALEARDAGFRRQLHYVPRPAPPFFTARVIADLGGLYARSVLVTMPLHAGSVKDAVAMDGRGVVGRVVQSGDRSARVLLITDLNSRVPVAVGPHGERALMVGTNTADPQLIYWRQNHPPQEGQIVLTSAIGGIFPAGLPVGVVHYRTPKDPVVVPFAGFDRMDLLRIFQYGHDQGEDLASVARKLASTGAPASGRR
jgi:rod shape-determining protein MreC